MEITFVSSLIWLLNTSYPIEFQFYKLGDSLGWDWEKGCGGRRKPKGVNPQAFNSSRRCVGFVLAVFPLGKAPGDGDHTKTLKNQGRSPLSTTRSPGTGGRLWSVLRRSYSRIIKIYLTKIHILKKSFPSNTHAEFQLSQWRPCLRTPTFLFTPAPRLQLL